MTKISLISGTDVWTELPQEEVRMYLAKGSRMGAIRGFADEDGTTPITISVRAIQYIYNY